MPMCLAVCPGKEDLGRYVSARAVALWGLATVGDQGGEHVGTPARSFLGYD